MAGYSPRSLSEKLGIKPGHRLAIVNPPRDYAKALGNLPTGVRVRPTARGPLDIVQFFTKSSRQLETRLASLARAIAPSGALWVSWPKRASGVATDITEDVVRRIALPAGLVDVKVCAVNDVWSGLKLVWRVKNR